MIRSIFGKERYLNEAKESDFAGKDTIIAVGAVGQKMVQKSDREMRRRDDGFAEKGRNYGVEAYYLTDKATADRLMSTCLFYSTVDPEDSQLLYMLKELEPVVVHRSAGTNFGYRTSNDFEMNCANLKQVMETVFGARDVKIFSFKTSWNGNTRFYSASPGILLQQYGTWESVELGGQANGLAKETLVKSEPCLSFRQYGQKLASMKDNFVERRDDLIAFLTMKSKPFSLSERDASAFESEKMMAELQEGGWEQQEFGFMKHDPSVFNPDDPASERTEIAADEYEKRREEEEEAVFDQIGADAADKTGVRRVSGTMSDGTWSAGFEPDGRYVVAHKYKMHEPSDSDFYERHSPFLEEFAKALPAGWKAEYTNWKNAPDSKMIGTKFIDSKEVDRTSGPWGTEDEITYSVVEELTLTRAVVSEGLDPKKTARRLRLTGDFSDEYGSYSKGQEFDVYPYGGVSPGYATLYVPGRECTLQVPWDIVEPASAQLLEDGGDCVKVDFPAWALDYWVNAEIGSVSRQERDQIEAWRGMMEANGYDTGLIDFGEEEFFSSSPEFGLPCDCVEAVVSLKKRRVNM